MGIIMRSPVLNNENEYWEFVKTVGKEISKPKEYPCIAIQDVTPQNINFIYLSDFFQVPEKTFDQFKEFCKIKSKSTSNTIMDFILEQLQNQVIVKYEDGSIGSVDISDLHVDVHVGGYFIIDVEQYKNIPCEIIKSFNPKHSL
jgi:hypothetical protein